MNNAYLRAALNQAREAAARGVVNAVEVVNALTPLVEACDAPQARCSCGTAARAAAPTVHYNKVRTLAKEDFPGFTNESLYAIVKSLSDRDVIEVHASNGLRPDVHAVLELEGRPGMRVDRSSVKGQLRYGVLKITGRTYRSDTPIDMMNLAAKTVSIAMKD